MYKDLEDSSFQLQSSYDSSSDDIARDFYIPVISESVYVDRASGFFSSRALACYAKGIEQFVYKGKLFRLLISFEGLNESDFELMKEGYSRQVLDSLSTRVDEPLLSSIEKQDFSNLAYLISIGKVDVRLAFRKVGIFHDKYGICADSEGNLISFIGSNNETLEAINYNHESFAVSTTWHSSSFDIERIYKQQRVFASLWNNEDPNTIVLPLPEVIEKKIISYSKGSVVVDDVIFKEATLVFDYDKENNQLILINNLKIAEDLKDYVFYHRYYRPVIDEIRSREYFFKSMTYVEIEKVIRICIDNQTKYDYTCLRTTRLEDYLKKVKLNIKERSMFGLEVKHHDSKFQTKFNEFSEVVNQEMVRPLRDRQLWDAFFMTFMKKSCNFSVPGAGKTASVYGVFAYLQTKQLISRIIVFGPVSAAGVWEDEFKACFGAKKALNLFSVQDREVLNTKAKRIHELKMHYAAYNLLFFNYEALLGRGYSEFLQQIIDDKTLVVFDEVHKIKAVEGKQAAQVLEIGAKGVYMIALSGTPIPNSYADIYNLLHLLYNQEYNDFFHFDLFELKNADASTIEEVNKKLQPFYCRTTKSQLMVPEANPDNLIDVCASKEENRLFQIISATLRNNPLALIIRLLQLETNPLLIQRTINREEFSSVLDFEDVKGCDINSLDFQNYEKEATALIEQFQGKKTVKFNRVISLVSDLVNNDHKIVVVWCIFVDSIKMISHTLEEKGILVKAISGEVDPKDRGGILNGFKQGKFQVLVTNPQTLGEAVSLHTVCHDAIYYEYSYNLVHLLQSKDRIHRLGLLQNQTTQYYFLRTYYENRNSVDFSLDDKIYRRLKEKENVMLAAIEGETLESLPTTQEDLEIIFEGL